MAELLDRIPSPLAAFADAVREAERASDRTGRFKRMFELGAALARYGAAVGLGLLSVRLGGAAPPGALAAELRRATRLSDGAWFALARSIGAALKDLARPSASLLAFAGSHAASKLVSARNEFAHAGTSGDDAPALLAALLEAAAPLLGAPLSAGASGLAIDTGFGPVPLDPWLPWEGGEHAMIDAPHRPGDPWRAWLVRTGEHRASAALDAAMRKLVGAGDVPVSPSANPPFVGHEAVTETLLGFAEEAAQGGVRVALVRGRPGIGLSRLCGELAVVAASKHGFSVLRSPCTSHRRAAFSSLARALDEVEAETEALAEVQHAVDAARKPIVAATPGAMSACVEQLEGALLAASRQTPLYWVIDDAQWADERTLELVGLLGERAGRKNRAKLVVLVGMRLGSRGLALDALLGRLAAPGQPGIANLRLRPLDEAPALKLVRGVAPAAPELAARVVAGGGGVPQHLVLPLLGWHEAGLLEWEAGCWRARPGALVGPVPGASELLRARVSSFFEDSSEAGAAAHDLLGLAALHGGYLPRARLLAAAVASGLDAGLVERVLEVIVEAQLLDVTGGSYGFAQRLELEAALANTEAARSARLHRALLDSIAREPDPRAEAILLAEGFAQLGDAAAARHWYEAAIARALAEGSFTLAAELCEAAQRLGGSPVERFQLGLLRVEALTRSGRPGDARAELTRLDPSQVGPREQLRARLAEARVRAANAEGGRPDDLALVRDADALGEPGLALDARLVAAVLVAGPAGMQLAGEAIALAAKADLARRYHAQIVRTQIAYQLPQRDLAQIAADIAAAETLAAAAGAAWMAIEPAVDLACIRSEKDPEGAERALAELRTRAEAAGLAQLARLALSNLAAVELRLGHLDAAAAHARELVAQAQAVGDTGHEGGGQGILADALLRAHADLDLAQAAADAAVAIKQRLASASVALALLRSASVAAARGDTVRARAAARAAVAAAEAAPYHDLAERAALWLALHLAHAGEPGARDDLRVALAAAERLGAQARPPTLALIAEARGFAPG